MSRSTLQKGRIWAVVLLIGAFSSGVWVGSQWACPVPESPLLPPFLYRSLLDSLELTREQVAAADEVVERHGRVVDSIMRAAGRSLSESTESAHGEIESLLDPTRRAAFRRGVTDLRRSLGIGVRARAPDGTDRPPAPRDGPRPR